jgi:hypothetical protein
MNLTGYKALNGNVLDKGSIPFGSTKSAEGVVTSTALFSCLRNPRQPYNEGLFMFTVCTLIMNMSIK